MKSEPTSQLRQQHIYTHQHAQAMQVALCMCNSLATLYIGHTHSGEFSKVEVEVILDVPA